MGTDQAPERYRLQKLNALIKLQFSKYMRLLNAFRIHTYMTMQQYESTFSCCRFSHVKAVYHSSCLVQIFRLSEN
jgi:hypothetical protein